MVQFKNKYKVKNTGFIKACGGLKHSECSEQTKTKRAGGKSKTISWKNQSSVQLGRTVHLSGFFTLCNTFGIHWYYRIWFIFTFSYLADAFIQSEL